MASIAERLALLITANPDDAIRGLNKLERSADRSIGKTESRVDDLGHSLTRIGAGMLSVGVLGGVGLARAARATSDLNEAASQTEQIFGDGADEIGDFAKSAADSIGQSERAARDATSEFGLLLKNMGLAADETVDWSKDLTVLASDMASFKNTSPEDAVLALGAALRGESEPIRRYGVMLDDATVRQRAVELGLAATTTEVDNNGKAQARLALIMEQTSDLQGDFQRTSDGLANSQRSLSAQFENFQANLGQGVLPIMERLVGTGTDLLEWFNQLDPATRSAVSNVATWGAGLLIAGGAASTVIGQVIKMRKNLALLATSLKSNVAGIVGTGGLVAALGVAVIAFSRWKDSLKEPIREGERLADTYHRIGEEVARRDFIRQAIADNEAMRSSMADLGVTLDDIVEAWDNSSGTARSFTTQIALLPRLLQESRSDAAQFSGAFFDLGRSLASADSAYEDLIKTGSLAEDPMEDSAEWAAGFAEAAEDAAEAADDFEQEWTELVSQLLGGLATETEALLLLEDIRDTLDEIDEMSTAEARAEMEELVGKYAELSAAAVESGENIEPELDAIRLGIGAIGDAAGVAQDDIRLIGSVLDEIDGRRVSATIDIVSTFSGPLGPGGTSLNGFAGPIAATVPAPTYGGLTAEQWGDINVSVNIDGESVATASANANRRTGGALE